MPYWEEGFCCKCGVWLQWLVSECIRSGFNVQRSAFNNILKYPRTSVCYAFQFWEIGASLRPSFLLVGNSEGQVAKDARTASEPPVIERSISAISSRA